MVQTGQQGLLFRRTPKLSSLDLPNGIGPWLAEAAAKNLIPLALAVACAKAEANFDPKAERWGTRTSEAIAAIGAGDWGTLQAIIDDTWPDISFGCSQRIVLYHYRGTREATAGNCMDVRQYVFDNTDFDLYQMCQQLAACLVAARQADLSPVDGDELLGALCVYNGGYLAKPGSRWWIDWAGNVASYRAALDWAAERLR